jgi:hypothetical protein
MFECTFYTDAQNDESVNDSFLFMMRNNINHASS